MQKMSGLDLQFAVAELAHLQGKRIAKIRRTASGVFLFKIGSEEILFEPGVRLHLTRQSLQATDAPDSFVGFLRKNLEGKTAATIQQYGNDRIVEISAKSKERLIFELFRKGNLILAGEDGTIYACLLKEEAGGRKISRGEKYAYPKATGFELKTPEKVAFVVQENEKGEPVSYSLDKALGGKEFATFSEAADFYYASQKEESGQQRAANEKMKKLRERLSSQKNALLEFSEKRKEAAAAGGAIYSDFERVESLLAHVKQMKKDGKTEGEMNAAIAGYKAKVRGSEVEIEL